MMLHFRDPAKLKTKKIVFEEAYSARDSTTLEQLKELSSKRRMIEESINESSSITTAIAREMSGGLTSRSQQVLHNLEMYLPLLENLIFHVGMISDFGQIVRWNSELKMQWTSALSSSSFFNFKDLVQSATLFREAAGVFHHLAHKVLPILQYSLTAERPPEVVSSVSTVMSLICLAEAQAVTIKRAEEKGTTVGLLAKLHHGVAELLDEAAGVLNTASRECNDISSRIVEFISCCKALHELKSKKYFAESLKIANQFGAAIGVLRVALVDVKKKKMPGQESWKYVLKEEIDKFAELLRKHEHENEFVWHEKVPSEDELPEPEGNKIASIIPYQPKRWERQLAFKI
ncbi:unnamed protein product [Prunus armeniaca]